MQHGDTVDCYIVGHFEGYLLACFCIRRAYFLTQLQLYRGSILQNVVVSLGLSGCRLCRSGRGGSRSCNLRCLLGNKRDRQ